ncbi:MAG: 30S ribosomal protein S8 [Deltaproteobacteria bacterium]|nr:30S ribosomal protein S8 [Deltaproteobacteria bacterium]
MMTDPIADMLTRIRNATMARLDRTEMPASKLKTRVAEILKSEGYISDWRTSDEDAQPKSLTVFLRYGSGGRPAIAGLKRSSRPGRRVYVGNDGIPQVRNGLGVAILSTSRGVMSDRDARRHGVGGELLCEVW